MPKKIPDEIRQEIFRLVADAFRSNRKLSVDDLYEKLLPKEFGRPLPVGRTKVWDIRKEALEAIKLPPPPSDPMWISSPDLWSPEAYPFLLALNRYCLSGGADGPPSNINIPESRQLFAREAIWGSKLYSALKDAPIGLSYQLVSMFAGRETVKEVYEQPIIIDDLVAFLTG